MLVSIALIILLAAGGLALSYVIERDETLMWRLAAGVVIGSCVYGTLAFVIGCFTGITVASLVAMVLTLSPLILFRDRDRSRKFKLDWHHARDRMQGGSAAKFLRFAFYVFFFIFFCLFFSQAMYQTPQGIFTGGSNNLGDLPFHLGAIFSFTDGANLPPMNPSWSGGKFSYPFIADIVTAGFMKLGADTRSAMVVQDIAWAFALLIILERFVARLAGDKLAGKFAPWLLFFSGGLGFVWFFQDYWAQGKGFFDFLGAMPRDYTIGENFRWGNSLITLFITQRSLLLGMPLTVIVLQKLWNWFESENVQKTSSSTLSLLHFSAFTLGLLAGMLPLVHLHSLAVLFVVTFFLFGLNPENWRTWMSFGIGVAVIAIPELIWSATGTATRPSEFFDWWFGWDKGEENFLWFWLKNTGLVIPLILAGLYLHLKKQKEDGHGYKLWLYYTPFVFLFLVSNAAKLAPWQWDNIKVLIYWYVGSLPLIAIVLSWLWSKSRPYKAVAAVCFVMLILSGMLDAYRTASGQIRTKVFGNDAINIAAQIRAKTPPNALFLNAATYNTAIALTGRQSLMRYPGHLSSHGIEYRDREADVEKMYAGGAQADQLLAKYGIDYVLVAQEEAGNTRINQEYFMKFPIVAQSGGMMVYKVR
jgi:hypothetical protein